jgi:nucleotide-binding universal stress UspA family protein
MIVDIKRILVPTDFSETSNYAIEKACRVASLFGAELYIIHVIEGSPFKLVKPDDKSGSKEKVIMQQYLMDKLEKLAKSITKQYHISVNTLLGENKVVEVIKSAVRDNKIDLIVMGTKGASGFKEVLIGSNAQKIVSKATCPVITTKNAPVSADFSNIVLPMESWNNSIEKLDYVTPFATSYKSTVHLLGIIESKEKADMRKVLSLLNSAEEYLKERKIPTVRKIIASQHSAKETLEYAKEINSNLIMVLTDRESLMGSVLPGVFARHIINHSEIPVMSIKPAMYRAEKVSFRKEPEHRVRHLSNINK